MSVKSEAAKMNKAILLIALSIALQGCTSIKGLFSSNDNTVLPGSRESVLPPDQQTARDPIVTGEEQQQAQTGGEPPDAGGDCRLNDPTCDPGATSDIDQEAGSAQIE
jgi:hypothetical protein